LNNRKRILSYFIPAYILRRFKLVIGDGAAPMLIYWMELVKDFGTPRIESFTSCCYCQMFSGKMDMATGIGIRLIYKVIYRLIR